MCWRGAVRLQSGTHHRLESCYYTKMSLEGSYRGQLAWSLTPTWQWDPGSHMPECMHVGRGGFCSRDVLRLPLHMCCVSVKSDPITHLSSTVCFHTTLKTHSVWPRDYLFDLCVSDIFMIQRFCASSLPSSFFMLPWFSVWTLITALTEAGTGACSSVGSFRAQNIFVYLCIPWTRQSALPIVGLQRMFVELTWISSSRHK